MAQSTIICLNQQSNYNNMTSLNTQNFRASLLENNVPRKRKPISTLINHIINKVTNNIGIIYSQNHFRRAVPEKINETSTTSPQLIKSPLIFITVVAEPYKIIQELKKNCLL